MTINNTFFVLLISSIFYLSACSDFDHHDESHPHDNHEQHEHDNHHSSEGQHEYSERSTEVFTHFSEQAELFVEFPTLVKGEASPFAAHFTWLDNFNPVNAGTVTITLKSDKQPSESFSFDSKNSGGIFRPVAIPAHIGSRELVVTLESQDRISTHNLGIVTVYNSNKDTPITEHEDDSSNISFLKEQQWKVEFATAPVKQQKIRQSLAVTATIRAAANNEFVISASQEGYVSAGKNMPFPKVGDTVKKGDILGIVGTRIGRDIPSLYSSPSGTAIRSPLTGVIAEVDIAEGSYTQPGDKLFHIVNDKKLWLETHIPEIDLPHIARTTGAWFNASGLDKTFAIETEGSSKNGKLIAFSKTIDPVTRTSSLIFEFDNPEEKMHIGMFAEAQVYTGKQSFNNTVPVEAIVNNNGIDTVYVMVDGENFETRIIQTGIHENGLVEILSGIETGERVVTRGAYLIKLASTADNSMAHGHAH